MKTTRFLSVKAVATVGSFVTLAVLAPRDASAAGTALDVQSARGTGMAAATTAMIDDSSAIFYNAAGIAQGKRLDAQVGINLISPAFSYTSPAGAKTTLPFSVVTPFTAYVTGGVTENLSLGVGVFTPFGLKLTWPEKWAGSHQISEAELQTFYINPTVAYKFGPLRIGAGFQLVRATVSLKRDIRFGDQEGSSELAGDTWGAGANAGIQLEAIKQYLSFGVHYRSAVKLAFDDGRAHFNNVPRNLQGVIHDQSVSTSVVNPDSLSMGVATRPIPKLVIDFDAVWLGWGKFEAIRINFPNDPSGSLNQNQAKNWNNVVNFHLGAEGELSDNWLLRGGVLVDPSPSPANTLTPDIPDSTRVNLALGGTYRHDSGFHVDLGYQFIILTGKTSTAPAFRGDYGGLVNILGISVGYATPREKVAKNEPWVDPAANPGEPAPAPAPDANPTPAPAPDAPPGPAPAPAPAPTL
jgi:long-chain fatty acid transport protein